MWKTLVCKFIQGVYAFLSESIGFCGRDDKNILMCFFRFTVYMCEWHEVDCWLSSSFDLELWVLLWSGTVTFQIIFCISCCVASVFHLYNVVCDVAYKIIVYITRVISVRIGRKFVIILSLKIPPHLKCVATLSCEMLSVLKTTIEKETTFVTTHFKKLTTVNNVFIVSVIV